MTRVRDSWRDVRVDTVDSSGIPAQAQAGDSLRGDARAFCSTAYRPTTSRSSWRTAAPTRTTPWSASTRCYRLRPDGDAVDGVTQFTGTLPLTVTGSFGYTVRVVPTHPQLVSPVELGLVTYAS